MKGNKTMKTITNITYPRSRCSRSPALRFRRKHEPFAKKAA